MSWWTYVQRVAEGASAREIARRSGIGQTSVNRWQTSDPKPESVRAFAHAYGRPVMEALIAAGIVDKDDAEVRELPADLSSVSTEALLAELRRRIPD